MAAAFFGRVIATHVIPRVDQIGDSSCDEFFRHKSGKNIPD